MKTMTTVDSYERTPRGAHKIVLGGTTAGTTNDEIGQLAQDILAQGDDANPVEVTVKDLGGGKLEIVSMQEITPPEELGGTAEPAPVKGEDVAKTEAIAPGSDPTGAAEPTLDDVITKGLEAYSDEALLAEVARRMA